MALEETSGLDLSAVVVWGLVARGATGMVLLVDPLDVDGGLFVFTGGIFVVHLLKLSLRKQADVCK